MQSFEEQNLIKECHNGNLDKFGLLYDRYADKIYRYVYYRMRHKEMAQDITAQVFFKALENIKNFNQSKGYFSAWLYRIAKNAMVDHYRVARAHYDIDDLWDLAGGDNPSEEALMKERILKTKELLKNLDAQQREIVIMRTWDDLSYREIAQITGKTEGNCKMIFSRAIAKLRERELVMLVLMGFLTGCVK
jgi:RNA polymerase sigma-70 factor (ECF subfamily)